MPGIPFIVIAWMVGAISGVFRRLPHQKTVVGQIVSIERGKTMDAGRTRYTAYVEYWVDGIPYTIKSKFKSATFYTGQKMRVAYNAASPRHAIVRPGAAVYAVMLGFCAAGIAVSYLTLFR